MKKLPVLLSLLMIFAFMISACAPAATPAPPPAAQTKPPHDLQAISYVAVLAYTLAIGLAIVMVLN